MPDDIFGIVGSTLGGTYEVEKAVAEGGFGILYRAYHGAFRAPVALKCLKVPPSLAAKEQAELLDQFRNEAALMFLLSAAIPAVTRPLHADAFTTADGTLVPFLVLEWLEGETLDSMIIRRAEEGRPPVTMKRLVRLLTPIARALERGHSFPSKDGTISISHCDVKPENIFLADFHGETVPKILDFGLAKMRAAAAQSVGRRTQGTGVTAFSPCYAAPEQWLPKQFGATGPWTDIYCLALTLVEAAAGRQIMPNDFQAAIGATIDASHRPTPRHEQVDVSDAVEKVFERALAVRPEARFPNMASFWNALEDASGAERSSSSTRAAGEGSERPGAASGPPEVVAPPAPPSHPEPAPNRPSPVAAPAAASPSRAVRAEAVEARPAPVAAKALEASPAAGQISIELADFTPPPVGKLRSKPQVLEPQAPPSRRSLPGGIPDARESAPGLDHEPSRPSRAGVAGRVSRPMPSSDPPATDEAARGAATWPRFVIPGVMVVAGIVVAAVDGGEHQFGSVQLNWIAGGVAGAGVLAALWRLFGSS